ncbi:MAG: anti-sigma factor domain-containing protein [Nitrososphaerales archaeon]
MNRLDHDQIAELLGAYALDAVEADEAAIIEEHVEHCARCAAELASLREVTGLIANSGGDASPRLWDAISARIDRPSEGAEAPAIRHLFAKDDHTRHSTRSRRWPARRPLILGAVAAGLLVIAGLGVQVGRLDHKVNQLQAVSEKQAITQAADLALSDPQAHRVALEAAHSSGPIVAQIAILPSGTAFLVNQRLPTLASDQTYQLWGQVGQELISLGVLGTAPGYVSFHVDPAAAVTSFAVTVEHEGGVVRSTHVPVAVSPTSA